MKRRDSLKLIALSSLVAGLPGCSTGDVETAAIRAEAASDDGLGGREPTSLSPHEFRTVEILVDYIIPADEHSVGAADANVAAFIDFILEDTEVLRTPFRGGLGWLDHTCQQRYQAAFSALNREQQKTMLDAIAWPDSAPPNMEPGVRFFNLLRNLTASGFWSSKIGVEDLGYAGNSPQTSWDGCPAEALDHLQLRYDKV